MPEFLEETASFLYSVAFRWVNLGGGSIIGFIFLWCSASKKEVPVNAFWWILGTCLAIALFQAWRQEHKKALARIGLNGRILHTSYFEGKDGRIGIVVKLQITNRDEPTIVDG